MIVVRKSQLQALEKKRRRTNLGMLLSGILIGATIGGMIALLLAPRSGEDTRANLYGRARGMGDKCKSLLGGCCCCGDDCECDDDCDDESCACCATTEE